MTEVIKKILSLAVYAPSGENCQPWKFEVTNNIIDIFNLPERDSSTWNQSASYMAHGALLENIEIASKTYGYDTKINVFPNVNNTEHTARVELIPSQTRMDELFDSITLRTTNRKAYKSKPLVEHEKKFITDCGKNNYGINFYLLEDRNKIEKLVSASCKFEEILFENEIWHNFFFSHINWSGEEEAAKKMGFFIETLEITGPAKKIFKIIKNWKIQKILNKLGFSKLVSKGNSKNYSQCSAIGALTIPNINKESFIYSGKVLQKIWLCCTKLNLNFHPLSGILFLNLKVLANDIADLNKNQLDQVSKSYSTIWGLLNPHPNSVLCVTFRIGTGEKPSAKSLRMDPQIIFH